MAVGVTLGWDKSRKRITKLLFPTQSGNILVPYDFYMVGNLINRVNNEIKQIRDRQASYASDYLVNQVL